jgi:hypothetical protein
MSAVVLKPGEGRTIPLGPICMVVQEDGVHTRGTLGLAEFEVPPATRPTNRLVFSIRLHLRCTLATLKK